MLYVSEDGIIDAERIKTRIFSTVERGKLSKVNGIVVHQTGGPTASSAFNSYEKKGAFGAHFLIDKDGTIYQTASVFKVTIHTGILQSRCYNAQTCSPLEFKTVHGLSTKWRAKEISDREYRKDFPDRYPVNTDALGIEIVGISTPIPNSNERLYEAVNDAQNASLKWLVRELAETLGVSMTEVYKHHEMARKMPTEASTARW